MFFGWDLCYLTDDEIRFRKVVRPRAGTEKEK